MSLNFKELEIIMNKEKFYCKFKKTRSVDKPNKVILDLTNLSIATICN